MTEQEFFEKMTTVWTKLSITQEHVVRLESAMATIERLGMTQATVHTRKDNGGMELLHPSGSDYERQTGRRREYIGKKPEAQEEAKARVERFHQHYRIKGELDRHTQKLRDIKYQIDRLEMFALGKQAKLFSLNGDSEAQKKLQPLPIDYNRLTPAQVVEYFRRSPILAGMADDVQAVLGKIEWAEVQKAA